MALFLDIEIVGWRMEGSLNHAFNLDNRMKKSPNWYEELRIFRHTFLSCKLQIQLLSIIVEESRGEPGGKQQRSWSQTGRHWAAEGDMTRHDTVAPHEF